MRITKKATLALASVASLALVTAGYTATAYAATPADSASKFYLLDAGNGNRIADGSTIAWDKPVVGSPDYRDPEGAMFIGSSDAQSVSVFIAPIGKEKTPSTWSAYADSGFYADTKNVSLPDVTLSHFVRGNAAGVKSSGGDYSLGVAFLKNNGVTLADAGVSFTRIHVTPTTGAWTFDSPTESTTPTNPPADSTKTGQVDIQASTIAATDGAFSLVVPTGAKAVLGSPSLVNNLSTSTGTLGQVTVKDGRVSSTPGWNLTSSVANFTNGTDTIDAKQLGVKPKVVSGPAIAAGGNTAGSASDGQFASAAAGTSGDSVLDADLTFVAPAKSKAGTYTSKMTLTLVSK